jgi:two-component system nitrate/nitrite response regulator NarL
MSPAHILVADDDPVFREAIRRFLESRGHSIGLAMDASEVTEAMQKRRWDVLVTDISMPGNESLELLDVLRESTYPLPVIVVTGNPSLQTAVTSLRRDAVDYLTKPIDFDQLHKAVERAIERGRKVEAVSKAREQLDEWSNTLRGLQEALVPHVVEETESRNPLLSDPLAALDAESRDRLSPREQEVLVALTEGSSTRELADKLFISEHTVRNHLKAIYRKLGVHSRTELFSKLTNWGSRG